MDKNHKVCEKPKAFEMFPSVRGGTLESKFQTTNENVAPFFPCAQKCTFLAMMDRPGPIQHASNASSMYERISVSESLYMSGSGFSGYIYIYTYIPMESGGKKKGSAHAVNACLCVHKSCVHTQRHPHLFLPFFLSFFLRGGIKTMRMKMGKQTTTTTFSDPSLMDHVCAAGSRT